MVSLSFDMLQTDYAGVAGGVKSRIQYRMMNIRSAVFFAIVGMALWTVLTAIQLIRSISAVASGLAPAVNLLDSSVRFVAALSLLVFFGAFYRSRS